MVASEVVRYSAMLDALSMPPISVFRLHNLRKARRARSLQ